MLTIRRILASLSLAIAVAAGAAEPAPASALPLKKLTLEDAIQQALAKNFSIKISGFGAEASRARMIESFGKFDPILTGQYSFSEDESATLRDPVTGLRPPGPETKSDSYDLSLRGLLPWGLTYSLGATSNNTRGTFNLFADSYSTFAGVSATQPLLRGGGLLLAMLILPLYIPVLIFGASATANAALGLPVTGEIYFLAGLVVLAVTLAPWATAAALRIRMS